VESHSVLELLKEGYDHFAWELDLENQRAIIGKDSTQRREIERFSTKSQGPGWPICSEGGNHRCDKIKMEAKDRNRDGTRRTQTL
jgi:hypothetical protein